MQFEIFGGEFSDSQELQQLPVLKIIHFGPSGWNFSITFWF